MDTMTAALHNLVPVAPRMKRLFSDSFALAAGHLDLACLLPQNNNVLVADDSGGE
jgi:hypothetical protein